MPILGLVYIWRVMQWYTYRRRFPALMDDGPHADLARQFRAALPRFWFAVLLCPGVVFFATVYLALN